ncbi:MAG: hypothetical protein L0387_27345 [Acidobacteria bacterium]|nr:hypothetical protein [Acidobacteriota bacterium]
MKTSTHLLPILASLVLSAFAPGQEPTTASAETQLLAEKDARAVEIAQQAIVSMGGNSLSVTSDDSMSSGTLTLHTYSTPRPLTMPIIIKTKGTRRVRTELQTPKGQNIRILNEGRAVLTRPDGKIQELSMNNTLTERVSHIPALSLLAEYADPRVAVEYMGMQGVNGQPVEVIALRLTPRGALEKSEESRETASFRCLVDSGRLVLKVEYTAYAENDSDVKQRVEVLFSDYQSISGVLVPFRQATYTNGKLESELVLASIEFNVGLSDAEFDLPHGEVANDR